MFIVNQESNFTNLKFSKSDVNINTDFKYKNNHNKVVVFGNKLFIYCTVREERLLIEEEINSDVCYWFMGGHIGKTKKEAEKTIRMNLWYMIVAFLIVISFFAFFIRNYV